MNPRAAALIARSVLVEAIRRREIYAIVLVAVLMIGGVMTINFFNIEGLSGFYREVALTVMSFATALTVIVLAARQLPREFEARTIYPLLARPVTRLTFLMGKLAGVMLAAAFCFILFMIVYVAGSAWVGSPVPWALFLQFIYLQLLMMLVLATLSFWLSMIIHLDAAITISAILYAAGNVLMSMTSFIYDYVPALGRAVLVALVYLVPQMPLFDLTKKTVHAEFWGPLDLSTILAVTVYGLIYSALYFCFAWWCFRRRAL